VPDIIQHHFYPRRANYLPAHKFLVRGSSKNLLEAGS
jgi:hypothetical protein